MLVGGMPLYRLMDSPGICISWKVLGFKSICLFDMLAACTVAHCI